MTTGLRRLLAALVVAGLLATMTACGSGTAAEPSGVPTPTIMLHIKGGNKAQRALANRAARLVGGDIQFISFKPPSGNIARRTHGLGLAVLATPDSPSQGTRAMWEANLVVSTYLGLVPSHPKARVFWASYETRYPDGAGGGATGWTNKFPALTTRPAAATSALRTLRAQLQRRAHHDHVTVTEFRTPATLMPTVAITVSADHPGRFLQKSRLNYLALLAAFRDAIPATVDVSGARFPAVGTYFELDNTEGRVLYTQSGAPGVGGWWVDPAYRGCAGDLVGDILTTHPKPPPSCPD